MMRNTALAGILAAASLFAQNKGTTDREAAMKADLAGQIDGMKKQAQVMVDSVFSFAELGMQEFETSKYLTSILEKEGFKVERGVAGMPTAWLASVLGSLRRCLRTSRRATAGAPQRRPPDNCRPSNRRTWS